MKVATRLRGAFAIYIALLAAVVVYHVRTIQRAVASGHALTEISSRLRIASTEQVARVSQMNSDAEKFLVTRDRGYFDKVVESADLFGRELTRLDSMQLSADERAALKPLANDWQGVSARIPRLASVAFAPEDAARDTIALLQQDLDRIRVETEQLGNAAQTTMRREVTASESAARAAERLSWLAALGALLLSAILSALLVRSIVGPLQRLAVGTREVSAGRFNHRLDASGDDELAQVSRDFNSMTERLDELDRMKRDFVAKVSHDLKTPLSSMQETISALLDGVAGTVLPKQRQLLELNLESGRRLSSMLNKLLDLSRIEAGLEPDMEMLDLTVLARRSTERAGAAPSPRRVRLTFIEPPHRVLVRGDASALAQVVDNLLENAIKFSPAGGEVTVRVTDQPAETDRVPTDHAMHRGLQGGTVAVTVSDEGPGIPDDEKERVFSRFYQTEAGRAARGRGVGLGLTICREIVNAHGGAIWASDNEPRGTVFHVTLPGVAYPTDSAPGAATDAPLAADQETAV
jgi:signal transduction histidine kinase